MTVIKRANLIALFPLTQPPPGTEKSTKGCLVNTETPSLASTKGWKPTMGHFQIINDRNGVKIHHIDGSLRHLGTVTLGLKESPSYHQRLYSIYKILPSVIIVIKA